VFHFFLNQPVATWLRENNLYSTTINLSADIGSDMAVLFIGVRAKTVHNIKRRLSLIPMTAFRQAITMLEIQLGAINGC
jgi:hypothetical protein